MNSTDAQMELLHSLRRLATLGSIRAVLDWDEQTQMPPRGGEARAEQAALLAGIVHAEMTSPRSGELLDEFAATPEAKVADSDAAVIVRETRRSYDRARKLPASLVEELARVTTLAQHIWAEAKAKSDFALFAPWLEQVYDLKRQEADCVGSISGNRYDALLDVYEPGMTADGVRKVFDSLRDPLIDLVRRVANAPRQAPAEILERHYPADRQEALAREAAKAIGFNFAAGRLDRSVHPFCSGIAPGDTRMTTRYDESYFGDAFFGTLHETGHALYEQGLPTEKFGTPLGESISLGIHESQSRMWENLVGRSRAFWAHFFPKAQAAFPDALRGVDLKTWHFAINDIRPSFIRTESDEVTYNLHVLLRFELEQALLDDAVAVKDLPGVWNETMRKYLGVTPPDDAQGCLQDIHWSGGMIGYFPTYTLGNLYSAQFFEKAKADLGDLDGLLAAGNFRPLLDWLGDKIHHHGKRFEGPRLVQKVTGKPLSAEPLMKHLKGKVAELYGV